MSEAPRAPVAATGIGYAGIGAWGVPAVDLVQVFADHWAGRKFRFVGTHQDVSFFWTTA